MDYKSLPINKNIEIEKSIAVFICNTDFTGLEVQIYNSKVVFIIDNKNHTYEFTRIDSILLNEGKRRKFFAYKIDNTMWVYSESIYNPSWISETFVSFGMDMEMPFLKKYF